MQMFSFPVLQVREQLLCNPPLCRAASLLPRLQNGGATHSAEEQPCCQGFQAARDLDFFSQFFISFYSPSG